MLLDVFLFLFARRKLAVVCVIKKHVDSYCNSFLRFKAKNLETIVREIFLVILTLICDSYFSNTLDVTNIVISLSYNGRYSSNRQSYISRLRIIKSN